MEVRSETVIAGNKLPHRPSRMEGQAVHQLLARLLLKNISDNSAGSHRLSRRTIAQRTGTSWSVINDSLRWMQENGAIIVDRNRMTIKEDIMNQIASNLKISNPGTVVSRNSSRPISPPRDTATSATSVSRATINGLIADLASNDGLVRVKAREQLVAYQKTSVAPLIKTLTDTRDHVRWEATKALSQIGSHKAIQALIKSLEDETFEIRWLAAVGLIQIGRRAIVPLLDTLVNHSDSFWLREGIHHVLHDMNKKNITGVLRPVLLALEGIEPSLEAPFAARAALYAIKARSH